MNARPITWPTVPKGRDRIRVCLHYGNSREQVEALAEAMTAWAKDQMAQERTPSSRRIEFGEGRLMAQPKL